MSILLNVLGVFSLVGCLFVAVGGGSPGSLLVAAVVSLSGAEIIDTLNDIKRVLTKP